MLRTISRSSLIVTAAGLVLGLTVAACSSGATQAPGPNGPTVSSLIKSMKAGFAAASSVRISGTGAFNGQSITLDVGMFRSGDMTGSVKENSLDVTVLRAGGQAYVYVSKAFFNYIRTAQNAPASACKLMCGKYIPVPSGSSFGKFTLSSLVKQFETGVPVVSSVPSIRDTTYQGQPAYELSNNKGQEVFLARNGTHYLLGMVDPGKFQLTFSEWNAVPPVTAPPPGKIFQG